MTDQPCGCPSDGTFTHHSRRCAWQQWVRGDRSFRVGVALWLDDALTTYIGGSVLLSALGFEICLSIIPWIPIRLVLAWGRGDHTTIS